MFDRDLIETPPGRRANDLASSFMRRMGCNTCGAPKASGDRHYCAPCRDTISRRSWDNVSKAAL